MSRHKYAIIHVRSGAGESWPVVERVAGGWQSGAHHYHDFDVLDVTPLVLAPGLDNTDGSDLVGYLQRYSDWWEVSQDGNGPWPDDPDGGELRIVEALHRVLAETDHADVRAIVRPIFEEVGPNAGVTFPVEFDLPEETP